jgi:hypothetical protein
MKPRTSITHVSILGSVFVLLLSSGSSLRAQTTAPLCTPTDYKMVSLAIITIQCDEDVSHLVGEAQLLDAVSGPGKPLVSAIPVAPYEGASQWLTLDLAAGSPAISGGPLQLGKKYTLAISLHPPGQTSPPGTAPVTSQIEASNTVAVAPAIALSSKNTFEFVSHFAYKAGPGSSCTLQVEDFSGRTQTIKARDCRVPAPVVDAAHIAVTDLHRIAPSPEDLGSFILTLDSANKDTQQIPVGVADLVDFTGKPVKLDSKSQLVPEKAPASKDASNYYINFNYAAGKGAKPGWVLDGKVAPVIGKLYHGYQISPSASADVGQNQVGSLKYTDTIDFGGSLVHMYRPSNFLQGFLVSPGITYETDREFDRHNLLATPDFRFNFVGLYNPRQRRSLNKFRRELEIADANKIPWTRANSKPAFFGYVLDFHTGFELGGALKDTIVKASSGKATLPLPSYNIARIVPQVHGLLELGRFSVDAIGYARYLTTVENTVLEHPDHTLSLERLHGWNGYGVITGSWTFDPAGHFAFTVSYKDGFAPPKFNRVNTVQSGITLKY